MKTKRLTAALLALCLALSFALVACTGQTPASTGSTAPSSSSTDPAGPGIPDPSGTVTLPTGPHTGPTDGTNPLPSTNPGVSVDPDLSFVTVIFVLGQGQTDVAQTLVRGACVQAPTVPEISGMYLAGWYDTPGCDGSPFDFAAPVSADLTLYAKWAVRDSRIRYAYGGQECAAFEWSDSDPSRAKVGYGLAGSGSYTYVDAPLIRSKDASTGRVDIVGLLGGKHYDFIIQASDGSSLLVEDMAISAYDRSGYAHFGYTQGVGAYKDDGTLKPGALVIYLTESNKNNVLDAAYVDGKAVDIRPYMGGGKYTGIGELLNNRRYAGSERTEVGIAKLCQIYGAVTVRVLGTVTAQQKADGTSTIVGLTDYSSTGNGGSVGDNGRMARMVDPKNLTIEGVGEDAGIQGWGVHFIASANGGESFEVRNLRFEQYPEDAVGMEGQQEGSTLTVPVRRCWIHHNSFYPGYCANPAESDKGEGDGSCDFKRGRYYTLSYNYFVDCHKTNLIGSSDSAMQFDITFHHNYWENCGSRIPLLRNANLHFYNNYISNDISQEYGSTGSKLALSYVSSVRANSYMFAENNYYDGCKNTVLTQSGGVVKAWGNTYYACFEDDLSNRVAQRTDQVPNSCRYAAGGIDYSSFDTDPKLFYYNASQKRSDCYLTDAVTARLEVMQKAGTQKRQGTRTDTAMNLYSPAGAVAIDGEVQVNFAGAALPGMYFNGKGSASGIKGKNQVVTFTLGTEAEVSVTVLATGKDVNLGELVDSQGKVWAGKFTQFTGNLPAGTYFIGSGSKDKEVTVTALVLKNSLSPAQKLSAAMEAIQAISFPITLESKAQIEAARAAYEALPEDLKPKVSNFETLQTAISQYDALVAAQKPQLLHRQLEALPDTLGASDVQAFLEMKALYDSMSAAQRGFSADQQAKFDSLLSQYAAMQAAAVVAIFTGSDPSLASQAGFAVSGNYKIGVSFTYAGVTYERPLKMESSTCVTFTVSTERILKLKLDVGNRDIKIDGVKYTADADGFVTVKVQAGSHTITKGETCNLCYAILQ